MKTYIDLCSQVLASGTEENTRAGKTLRVIFLNASYPVNWNAIPIVTTKKILFSNIVKELIWFLNGQTDAKILSNQGCVIWNKDSHASGGDCGPIYGFQWRHYGADYVDCSSDYTGKGFDQIAFVIDQLKNNPTSRRIILTGYNPTQQGVVPPCHHTCQFLVNYGRLDMILFQRSGDLALGVPYNITSYSLLMCLLCKLVGLLPGILHHTIGDAHVYQNHVENLQKQCQRTPLPLPGLIIEGTISKDLKGLNPDQFKLINYQHEPMIHYPLNTGN